MNHGAAKVQQQRVLQSTTDIEIRDLYLRLIESWNERSPNKFAGLFSDEGVLIGFDGSQAIGALEIERYLCEIFSDPMIGRYVGKVKHVQLLSPSVGLLSAMSGMIPPGRLDIEPKLNAVQTVVAVNRGDMRWRVMLFQNTPALFHGRPELIQKMTEELQELL
jgi:uncharacterized protein (TIGR02246 family)